MLDTPVDLINVTVQLEQPKASGGRTVGTGFLLAAPGPDGTPGTVLITANHVFAGMGGSEAKVGYRSQDVDGTWRYTPRTLRIRDAAGKPLWTRHPQRDVAAIRIKAPPEIARKAIPASYLAVDPPAPGQSLGPGDELLVLGFPRGIAANNAGFPILRSGRVASYPLSASASPTFLLDFAVFPGNSGGPVFAIPTLSRMSSAGARPFIAGLLTQQVELDSERLEIGIVTHARFIAETIALIDGVGPPVTRTVETPPVQGARPASDTSGSPIERSVAAVRDEVRRLADRAETLWRRFALRLAAWIAPGYGPPTGQA